MPRPLYLALTRRDYTQGDAKYSVTTLLKPPRILQLERRYDDQIAIDCRRNAKALVGSAWHDMMERKARQYPEDCEVVEQIMFDDIEVTVDGQSYTVKIKGQNDFYNSQQEQQADGEASLFALEQGILWDYKTCSQWILRYGIKEEWVAQLNIYARQLRKRGYTVTGLRICPMYTDWKKRDNLSKFPIGDPLELAVWTDEQIDKFLIEQVTLHEECELLPDAELPPCTFKDRWMRVAWKVRKTGDARFKVLSFNEDEAAARAKAEELGPGHIAFFESSDPIRCIDWCPANLFCDQFKAEFPDEYQAEYDKRMAADPTPLVFNV